MSFTLSTCRFRNDARHGTRLGRIPAMTDQSPIGQSRAPASLQGHHAPRLTYLWAHCAIDQTPENNAMMEAIG